MRFRPYARTPERHGMKKQQILILGLVVVLVALIAAIVLIAVRPTGTSTTSSGTLTKVPSSQTPAQFVESYYKAVVSGDFETAYKFLPVAKQQTTSLADFTTQLKGYGITSYKMGSVNQSGSSMTIDADEVTASYGTFTTIWTFAKQGSAWVVEDKAVAGMQ